MALLLAILQPLAIVALKQPMLGAKVAPAEAAVPDNLLLRLLALPIRALLELAFRKVWLPAAERKG